ncbi:dTDP-4-dehydrorhamnose 3,5-epimerase [Oscillochloris trichoides DG-6]|uniref:dTDP-4-dehydrorhamnose 3,5-epimerase n=1 Tax=Oscillochloris trichoides DG-6 TaxID=765420 RepID=E1I9Q4_9CHLR|nr:dTDP-4-dehydrorhamnose 3,5-epimerase [Oscillochloris trichoides]EFO82132.1 dTDP-4-dehydrorhamnose 3,5-epimerase [Oscillochloris trichoides DG-6]
MYFTPTELSGAYIIDLQRFEDNRGFFACTWEANEFAAQGLSTNVVQANLSYNRTKGTLRGMHFQHAPYAEVKLIRCVRGAIVDVIIDLRPDSESYKRWISVELSADNRRALYIPEGFAHGFQTLVDDVEVMYQVSQFYTPSAADGVRYDDPAFGITWPLPVSEISPKDAAWAAFAG